MMGLSINHNIGAMNALSALDSNSNSLNSALQQLSTGKRINSAADDAAGYAISQKMQGQINGLDQASQNAQDGISMIQTASGAMNQTVSILQQMRTLATQASNGTTTTSDRQDLQTEFNQLASQINNIGNTTQFNTQNLLQGNGASNLSSTGSVTAGVLSGGAAATTTQASQATTITTAAAAGDTITFDANGQTMKFTFAAVGTTPDAVSGVTATGATINLSSTPTTGTTAADLQTALQDVINANSTLKGQYTATVSGSGVTLTAVQGGQFDGAAGNISAVTSSGTVVTSGGAVATGTNVAAKQASSTIDFSSLSSAQVTALAGKGFTINGQEIQFYNADNGPYTGSGIGVNISAASTGTNVAADIASQVGSQVTGVSLAASAGVLTMTATQGGTAGNSVAYSDGGTQKDFEATFQIGANTGQALTLNIGDVRAAALNITGDAGASGYSQANNVNNGTNNTNIQAALDITSTANASKAISTIDSAIQTVTTDQANLGAVQTRLQSTMSTLSTSSQNLTTAVSGITDTNMAAEMTKFTQDSVLQQAAVSMLAQANQQPQLVLKLLQ